jgi:hypothetical protein
MSWLLLEALAAGLIFVGIVWWTMFSGRRGGERLPPPDEAEAPSAPASPAPPSPNPTEPRHGQ